MQEEDYGHEFPIIYLEFNKNKISHFNRLSLEQLKKISRRNESTNKSKNENVTVFSRSLYVKEFAKRIAAGRCQLCEKPSPFMDKMNEPFLEVHHIEYLSKGGSDKIENVVALCPNCHRKVHILESENDYTLLMKKALENLNV